MLRSTLKRVVRPVAATSRGLKHYTKGMKHSSIWLGDTATYPLLIAVGSGAVLTAYFTGRMFTQAPHVMFNKNLRMKPITEGADQTEEDTARYYNHSLRRMGQRKFKEMME